MQRNPTTIFSPFDLLVRCVPIRTTSHLAWGCNVSPVQLSPRTSPLDALETMSLRSFESSVSSKDSSEDCVKVLLGEALVVCWLSCLMGLQNYEIVKRLGDCVLSEVYLATCKRGRLKRRSVVLKKVLYLVGLYSSYYKRSNVATRFPQPTAFWIPLWYTRPYVTRLSYRCSPPFPLSIRMLKANRNRKRNPELSR